MISLPSGTKIWLVVGITDMRNGFNGLAAKVQTTLKDDPMSGHVFIFRGRNGSQVKLLWSTGDGLCLLTKRLERGRFAWPSARDGKVFLTPAQLAMLLEGIDWRQPKRLLTSLTMLQASLSWSTLNEPGNIPSMNSSRPDNNGSCLLGSHPPKNPRCARPYAVGTDGGGPEVCRRAVYRCGGDKGNVGGAAPCRT